MLELFKHQWKELMRSSYWPKNISLKIIYGIFAVYMVLSLFIGGVYFNNMFIEVFNKENIIEIFMRFLFYYFLLDLLFRFFYQKVGSISILPYLPLPVKNSTLFHFYLIKSSFSIFNLIPIFIFSPFFLKVIFFSQSLKNSIVWLFIVLSLISINNSLQFVLKSYASNRPYIGLIIISALGVILYVDITDVFLFSHFFRVSFNYLLNNSTLIFAPILTSILVYKLAFKEVANNIFKEDSNRPHKKSRNKYSVIRNHGELGQLISIELKMILRNKMTRSFTYISFIFLLCGLFFYKKSNINNDSILILAALISTSMLSLNYCQYFFSWESSFFDTYLINKVSTQKYITSKYFVFLFGCIASFILTLPYAFVSHKILLVNGAFLLYGMGISSIIMLFFTSFNSSYIDLGKSPFMNHQGTSLTQVLVSIVAIGIPFFIYFICSFVGLLKYYYPFIGLLGLFGIILNKYLIKLMVKLFLKRKDRMALSFRRK